MQRKHPLKPWCRYADDGLVHCKTEGEARQLLAELTERFQACGLELHPDKTKIIYCKDGKRQKDYPNKSFEFLGYEFRARGCKGTLSGDMFTGFTPAVSKASLKSMRSKIRASGIRNRSQLSLNDIARIFNPILQGWMNYYGKYTRSELYKVWRHFNSSLVSWAMRKYKSLKNSRAKAMRLLARIANNEPSLFVHWRKAGVEIPRSTHRAYQDL